MERLRESLNMKDRRNNETLEFCKGVFKGNIFKNTQSPSDFRWTPGKFDNFTIYA